MTDKRGFHFLAGLASLWLTWRLYQIGFWHDVGLLAAGIEPMHGPGAVLIGLFIEAVIALGMVVVLVVSGLWELLMVAGRLVHDVSKTAHAYLYSATRQKIAAQKAVEPGEKKPAVAEPQSDRPKPVSKPPESERDALLLTIADTRAQTARNAKSIDQVLAELGKISQTLAPKTATRKTSKPKVAK